MAGEYLQASRYRLKAVLYKRKAFDMNGATAAIRVATIYKDSPAFTAARYKVTAVVAKGTAYEYNGAASSMRVSLLYQDPPSFTAARYKVTAVVAKGTAYEYNGAVSAARFGVIIKSPHGAVNATRMGFIISQSELGPPARIFESFEMVMQNNPVPPPGLIFSPERVSQNWQMVMQKNPVTPPTQLWSMTRAAAAIEKVLLARPAIRVQSYQYVLSVARQALIPSLNYVVQSRENTLQVTEMTLLSLVNVTPAVSMDYAKAAAEIVLMAKPMAGLPTSPATTYSICEKVLRRRPLTFPQSDTRVSQYVETVLRKNSLPLGQSLEYVPSLTEIILQGSPVTVQPQSQTVVPAVTELALQSSAIVRPISTSGVLQEAETVLINTDMPAPFGPVRDIQTAELVLMYTEISTQSVESVATSTEMVLQGNPMPPPGAMSGALTTKVAEEVLIGQPVQAASTIRSKNAVVQAGLKWLLGATYPKPGDMVPAKRAAQVPEIAHVTLQRNVQPKPWSFTRVVAVANKTLMFTKYDTPAEMLRNGAFMSLVVEQAMWTADYPSTSVPSSTVVVDINAEQALTTADDYPDKGYSISDAIVSLVAAQELQSVSDYPDKDQVQSDLIISMVTENAAFTDNSFPDKDLPQSAVVTDFVAEQALAAVSDYPDKDMVQSALSASFVAEIVASKASYPDKDTPQGALEVTLVSAQVLSTDPDMYTLPSYPGRNKPMVFTTIVY